MDQHCQNVALFFKRRPRGGGVTCDTKIKVTCDTSRTMQKKHHLRHVGWGGVGIITNLTPYTGRISLATMISLWESWVGVGWGGDNNKPDALHWPDPSCESSTKPSLRIIYKIQASQLSTRSMFHVTSDTKISVTSDAKISVTSEDLTRPRARLQQRTTLLLRAKATKP